MKGIVLKYINELKNDHHRYKSWEHCFEAFKDIDGADEKLLSLHLAFYLASWGMYRGSSELLQNDYLVHEPVLKIIQKYKYLRTDIIAFDNVKQLNDVVKQVKDAYEKTYKDIKVSRTLATKILLGTLGCLPALDRYFRVGWKTCKETEKLRITLSNIVKFANDHKSDIEECRENIKSQIEYPSMKIVDMYFWQIGYNEEMRKNNEKKKGK